MKNRIVIYCDGGVIQWIITDDAQLAQQTEIVVLDYIDSGEETPNEITVRFDEDNEDTYVEKLTAHLEHDDSFIKNNPHLFNSQSVDYFSGPDKRFIKKQLKSMEKYKEINKEDMPKFIEEIKKLL